MFKSLKIRQKCIYFNFFIDSVVSIISHRFCFSIVNLMFECILSEIDRYEVAWKSQICDVVVFSEKFFFFSISWNAQSFFKNFVKLIQIRQYLECELFHRSTTIHGSWMNKPEKCFKNVRDPFFARPIAFFEQVFVFCSRSSKTD